MLPPTPKPQRAIIVQKTIKLGAAPALFNPRSVRQLDLRLRLQLNSRDTKNSSDDESSVPSRPPPNQIG